MYIVITDSKTETMYNSASYYNSFNSKFISPDDFKIESVNFGDELVIDVEDFKCSNMTVTCTYAKHYYKKPIPFEQALPLIKEGKTMRRLHYGLDSYSNIKNNIRRDVSYSLNDDDIFANGFVLYDDRLLPYSVIHDTGANIFKVYYALYNYNEYVKSHNDQFKIIAQHVINMWTPRFNMGIISDNIDDYYMIRAYITDIIDHYYNYHEYRKVSVFDYNTRNKYNIERINENDRDGFDIVIKFNGFDKSIEISKN